MPKEALNCPNCGSPKVSEFKPGSFVCSNCGSTFKWVDPSRQTVHHTGEVITKSEALRCKFCEIEGRFKEAIGQCVFCKTACCNQHGIDDYNKSSDMFFRAKTSHGHWHEVHEVRRKLVYASVDTALTPRLANVVFCRNCRDALEKEVLDNIAPLCPVCHLRGYPLISVQEVGQLLNEDCLCKQEEWFWDPPFSTIQQLPRPFDPLASPWFWNVADERAKKAREFVLVAAKHACEAISGICLLCLLITAHDAIIVAIEQFNLKCPICGLAVKRHGDQNTCGVCGAWPLHNGCTVRKWNLANNNEVRLCTTCLLNAKEVRIEGFFSSKSYDPPRWKIGNFIIRM